MFSFLSCWEINIILVQVIDIEKCSEKNQKRENHYRRAYNAVYDYYTVGGEVAPYLVDKPRQTVPPEQCSEHNAQIAHAHL